MKNEQFSQKLRVINLLRFSLFIILPISSTFAQGPTPGELAEANKASTAALELFKQGKYQEALKPATQALEIRTKILGLDSPQTKSAQLDLAEINIALGKYEDAEVLLDQVIKWYKGRSPNDVVLARILGRMSLVQYVQGNLKRTTALYEDAIGILERVYGTNDERVVPALFNFAEYLQVTGNLERAEGLYKRLAATKENSSSQQRPGLSDVLDRYSCLLFKAGRAKEAQDMEMRAGLMPGVLPTPDRAEAGPGTVLNGKAISLPKPGYPPEAERVGAQGTVTVRVVISETGDVIRSCATSGPPTLLQVSERAAYAAKFTPTKLSGQPVKVQGTLTYNFVHQ